MLDDRSDQTGANGANPIPEGRTSQRQLTLLRVGALTIDDRRELCVVRNISTDGLQMRVYSDVRPGTKVTIELKQDDPIAATVVWSKEGSAGVKFDYPIDVDSVLSHLANEPRPRMPRIDVNQPITLREGANIYRGRVLDISQGGVRVECDATLPINSDVVATLPGLAPIAAVAKWGDGRHYGLGFNRVLTISQLVEWLQDQPPVGGFRSTESSVRSVGTAA